MIFQSPQHPFIEQFKQFRLPGHARVSPQVNLSVLGYAVWYAAKAYGKLKKKQFRDIDRACVHWHEGVTLKLKSLYKTVCGAKVQKKVCSLSSAILSEVNFSSTIEYYLVATALRGQKAAKRNINKRVEHACENMLRYYRYLGVCVSKSDLDVYLSLLIHLFPEADPAELESSLQLLIEVAASCHCEEQLQLQFY